MFLASLLRRIAFEVTTIIKLIISILKNRLVVIHIPDQIKDAMAIFLLFGRLNCIKLSIFNCYVDN